MFIELAIDKIEGKSVEGRRCTRKPSGSIFLYDLGRKGPNRAVYDPRTDTIETTTKVDSEIERTITLWRSTDGTLMQTTTAPSKSGGADRMWTGKMRRGRHPEGCLARTTPAKTGHGAPKTIVPSHESRGAWIRRRDDGTLHAGTARGRSGRRDKGEGVADKA